VCARLFPAACPPRVTKRHAKGGSQKTPKSTKSRFFFEFLLFVPIGLRCTKTPHLRRTHIRTHTHANTHIHKGGKDVCTRAQGKKERERDTHRRKDQFAFHVLRRGKVPGCKNEGWNLAKKKQRRRHDPKMCSATSAAGTIQNLRRRR
jgi:hypothetical protein